VNSTNTGARAVIDAEHLRLLSIFHFVAAGFACMAFAFASFYLVVFQVVFANPEIWSKAKGGPPPAEVVTIMRWILGIVALWFLGSGVGNLLSAIFLRARRHRTFSMVTAGFNCLHVPIGTALGVFTFIVLGRESVRQLYEPEPVHSL
jgi:hypothetical protein